MFPRNRVTAGARASRSVLIPADSVVSSSLCRYHTMSGNAAIEEVQNRGKALPRVRMRASKQVAALFALAGNWINRSCQFAVLIQLCCCRGWQHRHARLRRAVAHDCRLVICNDIVKLVVNGQWLWLSW